MINTLLLPGLLCDASYWTSQRKALEPLSRTWVPDYRSATRLEEMAEISLELVNGPIAVAAHSMGARVALEIWRSAPDRVTRLALFDFGVVPVAPGEHESRKVLTDLSANEGIRAAAETWVASMVHPDRTTDEGLIGPLHSMVESYTPEQHAGQVAALLDRRDLWPLLPTITVPTLVAVGRQDPWRSVEHHRDMAAVIPGAQMVVIEDCGHMAPAEQPEVVSRLLVDWLAGPVR